MADAVGDPTNVTTEDLSGLIGRPVKSFCVRPWERYSSHEMRELTLNLADGSTMSVMFKGLHAGAYLEEARKARPPFYYDARREIDAYQSVLAHLDLDTPRFFGARVDETIGQYWLVVENVRGARPMAHCGMEHYLAAARWLARLHAAKSSVDLPLSLLRYDETFYRRWAERAAKFSPKVQRIVDPDCYDHVVRRLLAMPTTFIHGEFYAANILIDGDRIRPIDWETAAIAPPLIDLAALTSGKWNEEQRNEIAAAYGPVDPVDLDFCRLHVAVQWLGWSDQWQPIKRRRYDWAAEAMRLAAKLGL